jgi:predicted nucleotidyltransferase component of viral defense system
MIKSHCFTEDWILRFKQQKDHEKIDKVILEKMIYALHLLERLKGSGLEFVFKGGTSLVILLDEGNRFSIDIDIICNTGRAELESILQRVVETSHFTGYELDARRSYKEGVPKAHYKFSFDSSLKGTRHSAILLDVLIEDSIYPELLEKAINTKWIEMDEQVVIRLPSIDAITGDKLTAFAPHTIGIPYFKGVDKQSFEMEICKQLFDLGRLFERIENMEVVDASYRAYAEREIAYKNPQSSKDDLTPEEVLWDTIETCTVLAKRGSGSEIQKKEFAQLQKGIRAFGNGYLMSGHFRIDDALAASAKVVYLAAKIMVNDLSPIIRFDGRDISELIIDNKTWGFLNRLKRLPDKSIFFYWYQAVLTLNTAPNSTRARWI